MLLDYAAREMESRERVVCDNADWVALVPFWAMWPFETMLLPKTRHVKNMAALDSGYGICIMSTANNTHNTYFWTTVPTQHFYFRMRKSLAEIMQRLTSRYDNLFETNFPYSMGFHGAPSDPDARSRSGTCDSLPGLNKANFENFSVSMTTTGSCTRSTSRHC